MNLLCTFALLRLLLSCPYAPTSPPSRLWWHQAQGYWSLTYQERNEDGVMLATHEHVGHYATDTEAEAEAEKRNAVETERFYTVVPVIERD